MKIFNSLTKTEEEFVPQNPLQVTMYTCGPTVYHYATIGNFRTYTTADLFLRSLSFLGYKVNYVMNLTDVGHLTGDNEGDADQGEDRLEKSAKREGKTAWDVAEFYASAFLSDYEKLNLTKPIVFAKATDHIKEQIKLIEDIEKKGLCYRIDDGIYFDTQAYEKTGATYGKLSNLDVIKEGARVEPNPQKKDPRDFALWKFSPKEVKRDMEWESPWGIGFPGWHIECSAMSMKYLGETIDIHAGGEDLRSTHHPNEIAQSEAATGKQFVKYWVHSAFLQVDGKRMGKSLGNAYTISELVERGYDPLSLRYFYFTGHYRKPLNFTFESLDAAQTAYQRLKEAVIGFKSSPRNQLSDEKEGKVADYSTRFKEAISSDLNMPQALSVVWEVVKSNIPSEDKYDLLISFDEVLGLNLRDGSVAEQIPSELVDLAAKRYELRNQKKFEEADSVRDQIVERGYNVIDTQEGVKLTKK